MLSSLLILLALYLYLKPSVVWLEQEQKLMVIWWWNKKRNYILI